MILSEIPRLNAEKYGHRPAYTLADEDKIITHAEFNERVNRVANGLLSLGLRRGDRVGIVTHQIVDFWAIEWACFKTGMVSTHINVLSGSEAVEYQLDTSGAKIVFVQENLIPLFDPVHSRLEKVEKVFCIGKPLHYMESYDEWRAKFPPTEPPGVKESKPDDPACIISTGGTTGMPKLMLYPYKRLWGAMRIFSTELQITPYDINYFPRSEPGLTTVDYPLNTPYLFGACNILSEKTDIKECLEIVLKYRPTMLFFWPFDLPTFLYYPEIEKYNPGSLRTVWGSGGLPLAEWARRCEEVFGLKYITGYCASEQSPMTWIREADYKFMDLTKGVLPQGPAAPGEELKIVDEQGKERDAWEIGEILARGQTMFVEYVDKPERTKEVIDEEGWMHTGDLGMLDARGYIYVYGRKEYTIASGGNRVPPSMVEAVLATHPAVKESITIGVPYKELGEAIKSIVVLRPEKKATTEELLDFCRERLPSYAVPKSLIIVDEIPKGAKSLPKMAEIKERWGEEL